MYGFIYHDIWCQALMCKILIHFTLYVFTTALLILPAIYLEQLYLFYPLCIYNSFSSFYPLFIYSSFIHFTRNIFTTAFPHFTR